MIIIWFSGDIVKVLPVLFYFLILICHKKLCIYSLFKAKFVYINQKNFIALKEHIAKENLEYRERH